MVGVYGNPLLNASDWKQGLRFEKRRNLKQSVAKVGKQSVPLPVFECTGTGVV